MPDGQVNEFDVEAFVSIAGGFPADDTVSMSEYTSTFTYDLAGNRLRFMEAGSTPRDITYADEQYGHNDDDVSK